MNVFERLSELGCPMKEDGDYMVFTIDLTLIGDRLDANDETDRQILEAAKASNKIQYVTSV